MPTDSALRGIPLSYIPSGYEFRRQIEGSNAGGFGEDADQAALVYTRGWSDTDWNQALVVYAAPAGDRALLATEKHPGQTVDLGFPQANAVYHDGLRTTGPGEMEQDLGDVVIHWERSSYHSITIYADAGRYAVRASKETVDFDELTKVARSFNLSS
jgi:hypothetical protein